MRNRHRRNPVPPFRARASMRSGSRATIRPLSVAVLNKSSSDPIYAGCGNLKDARANNFQPLSCFCQTCRTPILVLVTLPSSSLCDTHRTHYGVITNNRDCEVWKIKRLEDSLSRHDRVDEFGPVFEV